MFSPTFLTFVLASLAVVKGVEICGYSDTLGCSGAAVCCSNIAANVSCGALPTGFGAAIDYVGLPLDSSDPDWICNDCRVGVMQACVDFNNQDGPGVEDCYLASGVNITTALWTTTISSSCTAVSSDEMVQPDVFKFPVDGAVKAVRIPAGEGAVETMIALFEAGNFTALEAYPPAN
ncbi:hypothetical protein B0H13DRAFT_2665732 [Mycena leptocephala]|nr:hypothetical protein B0H13DRAFT_2665732 [Mycena leptocephala]